MHPLGSGPHPAVCTLARLTARPTAEPVPRRGGAGAGAPYAATEVTW